MTPPPAILPATIPASTRFRPVWALVLNVLCITAAEIFLKMGTTAAQASGGSVGIFGIAALQSCYTVVGIVFHVSGFGLWMYALRTLPVSLAFNFTALAQVLVPVSAWVFLHEGISLMRWGGIAIVIVGFVMLVPVVARVEEKTDA